MFLATCHKDATFRVYLNLSFYCSYNMSKVTVLFRGIKAEFDVKEGLTPGVIKRKIIDFSTNSQLLPSDIKLLFKGRPIDDDTEELQNLLKPTGKKVYKIIAMGRSSNEVNIIHDEHAQAKEHAPRIRDDLTRQGQRNEERRRRIGRQILHEASRKEALSAVQAISNPNGFGKIEILPNMPDQDKARDILNQLASDPGILACMKKHNWYVGSLAELYPEGEVGQSEVCLMGLNKNKGQQILLRLRTDDLKGFRKMLSIRKVLFHELAHNVHSEHDGKFFQLMRQIELECYEMDWTQGEGLSSRSDLGGDSGYAGGTFRLGGDNGGDGVATKGLTPRELRAEAAMKRMTAEEEEIQQHCGCGREANFLPQSLLQPTSRSDHGSSGSRDEADMDAS
jgi:WLM domain